MTVIKVAPGYHCTSVLWQPLAGGARLYKEAGFTLYMVTIIEIYSVKPALNARLDGIGPHARVRVLEAGAAAAARS
jgi:hypothetical protein